VPAALATFPGGVAEDRREARPEGSVDPREEGSRGHWERVFDVFAPAFAARIEAGT